MQIFSSIFHNEKGGILWLMNKHFVALKASGIAFSNYQYYLNLVQKMKGVSRQ